MIVRFDSAIDASQDLGCFVREQRTRRRQSTRRPILSTSITPRPFSNALICCDTAD